MTQDRAIDRLGHIKTAILDVYDLLEGKAIHSLRTEKVTRAAFERFIEIISEASRHVPEEWKSAHPTIAWLDIANIGNRLRHGYDKADVGIMWDIYEHDLAPLEAAVDKMIDDHAHRPDA